MASCEKLALSRGFKCPTMTRKLKRKAGMEALNCHVQKGTITIIGGWASKKHPFIIWITFPAKVAKPKYHIPGYTLSISHFFPPRLVGYPYDLLVTSRDLFVIYPIILAGE